MYNGDNNLKERKKERKRESTMDILAMLCSSKIYLELHGCVFLVLWCGVALVVEVVGGGGVNDRRLLGRLVETLTVHIDQEGQEPRPQEAGHARGDQVDRRECWGN